MVCTVFEQPMYPMGPLVWSGPLGNDGGGDVLVGEPGAEDVGETGDGETVRDASVEV
jgi:hypothetical protein